MQNRTPQIKYTWVAVSRAFLKKYFSMFSSPFHDVVREWYNDKAIEYSHLYAYEGESWHYH